MILAIMNAIYAITYIEAWKIQDFNGDLNPWPRDAGAKFNIWNTSYVTGSRFRKRWVSIRWS